MKDKDVRQLVYVLENEDTKRIKIGITNDIEHRLKTLKYASGCNINVLYLTHTLINASDIEGKTHKELNKYRYIGEWFNVDAKKAIYTLNQNVLKHGIKIKPKYNKEEPKKTTFQKYKCDSTNPTEVKENLDITKYKRIEPGIYADSNGDIYSIKYRINGGWSVTKLDKLN